MSQFRTRLEVAPDDDERTAKLLTPLVYDSDVLKCSVVVPEGFSTDFASVPRVLWNIVPPTGKYGRAAVIHDYLYRTQTIERSVADAVFLEAMEATGVSWCERKTIYWAVRSWGWISWRNNRKKLIPVNKP